jgi:NADPH:quinone reductase-like Zn-dependent oxidoreductase
MLTGTTATHALTVSRVGDGDDTVLIHGAPAGVGVMAVQLAMRGGARVIGTASESRHADLRELGTEPVAYRAELDHLVDTGDLPVAARPGAETAVWAAVHGLATLLADGIIQLDDPQTVDRTTERLIRATLTGLSQEAPPTG